LGGKEEIFGAAAYISSVQFTSVTVRLQYLCFMQSYNENISQNAKMVFVRFWGRPIAQN